MTDGYYSEIAESSYPGYYEQPESHSGTFLGAFNVGGTDLTSWAQVDPSANPTYYTNTNFGSVPSILPNQAL